MADRLTVDYGNLDMTRKSIAETTYSGWVHKRGGTVKGFKRRFFVYHASTKHIRYFKDHTEEDRYIDLNEAFAVNTIDKNKFTFEVQTVTRAWNLMCECNDEYNTWLELINEVINNNRQFHILKEATLLHKSSFLGISSWKDRPVIIVPRFLLIFNDMESCIKFKYSSAMSFASFLQTLHNPSGTIAKIKLFKVSVFNVPAMSNTTFEIIDKEHKSVEFLDAPSVKIMNEWIATIKEEIDLNSIVVEEPGSSPTIESKTDTIDNSENNFSFIQKLLNNWFKSRPTQDQLMTKGIMPKPRLFEQPIDNIIKDTELTNTTTGIPKFLKKISDLLLEREKACTQGLFRVSGGQADITSLKARLDAGESPDFSHFSPHTLSGVMKLFFRSMPEPLLVFDLYDDIMSSMRDKNFSKVPLIINQLPVNNSRIFSFLIDFLARLSFYSDFSKMQPSNLAIVFAPNLLRPRVETLESITRDAQLCIQFLQFCITEEISKLKQNNFVPDLPSNNSSTDEKTRYQPELDQYLSPSKLKISKTTEYHTRTHSQTITGISSNYKPHPIMISTPPPTKSKKKLGHRTSDMSNITISNSPGLSIPDQPLARRRSAPQAPVVNIQPNNEDVFILPPPWNQYTDPTTGKLYYHNPETNQTTWNRPVK